VAAHRAPGVVVRWPVRPGSVWCGWAVYGRAPDVVDMDPLPGSQPRSGSADDRADLERAMTGRISPDIWLSGTRPSGAAGNADHVLV
jgi:hypothetical protein